MSKKNRYSILTKWPTFIRAFILVAGMYLPISVFAQQKQPLASSAETCASYILISGESNINQFNFTYDLHKHALVEASDRSKDSGQLELVLPIKDFKTSNPLMYDDFLQMMKESQYPRIVIGIPENQLVSLEQQSNTVCPSMNITIAGITRTYKIDCSLMNCSENTLLIGSQKIMLSDFKLKPPEKLYGLVKVDDEITVNFSIILTFMRNNSIAKAL